MLFGGGGKNGVECSGYLEFKILGTTKHRFAALKTSAPAAFPGILNQYVFSGIMNCELSSK